MSGDLAVVAADIVIAPELENWVWAGSPRVARELGWSSEEELRGWLAARGYWSSDARKPDDPKAAYQAALRENRLAASASRFRRLAESVSFRHCEDTAFQRLLSLLRTWFPRE